MFKTSTMFGFILILLFCLSAAAIAQMPSDEILVQIGKDCTHDGHLKCKGRAGDPATCTDNNDPCELRDDHDPKWVRCYCKEYEPNKCSCYKSKTH